MFEPYKGLMTKELRDFELEERDFWLWLTRIPGIGKVKIKALLAFEASPKRLFHMDDDLLDSVLSRPPFAACDLESFRESRNIVPLKQYVQRLRKLEIGYVTMEDANFPIGLYGLYEPVFLLYFRGKLPTSAINIAMVGSRRSTAYGRKVAEVFSRDLAEAGVNIISGLATGIDGHAHRGALLAGGFTTAVLGCGINICYPKDHVMLMEEIAKTGCIISEYGLDVPPKAGFFPMRNRLISGLSDGVLLVEAKEKSGSLITVDYALDQGKDIFAVPGDVLGASNKGSNNVIRAGGKPVFDVSDLLEEYGLSREIKGDNRDELEKTLEVTEKIVYSCISLSPIYIEEIGQQTQLSIRELQYILTKLEIKGAIHQLPNRYYMRS